MKLFKNTFLLCALGIAVLACVVRFFALGTLPVSLYWDETAMIVDVQSVVATGKDMHGNSWFQALYPSYGDYKLPVYIILASLSGWLFGPDAWSLRLVSALAGIGTVTVAGLYAFQSSRISGDSVASARVFGLATSLVIAVSPWSILFSRTGFEGHVAQFFVAVSLTALVFSYKKPTLLILSAVLGALATYTYFSVRFVWPVVFCLISAWMWWHTVPEKELGSLKKVLLSGFWYGVTRVVAPLLLFGILLIPMITSPLYQTSTSFRLGASSILNSGEYTIQANIYREMAGNSRFDRVVYHRWWLLLQTFANQVSNHINLGYLFVEGDANLRHGTGHHGLFLLPMVVVFFLGLVELASKKTGLLLLLLAWWCVALIPASVPLDTPHALRSLNALLPLSLILGWGCLTLFEWAKQSLIGKIFVVGYAAVVLLFFAQFAAYYFTIYPAASAADWQDGYDELAQVVLEHEHEVQSVWIRSTEEVYYLWLLKHGLYTPAELQAKDSIDYKFKDLGKFHIGDFDIAKITSVTEPIMVASDSKWMAELVAEKKLTPTWSKVIPSHAGTDRFTVLIFKP